MTTASTNRIVKYVLAIETDPNAQKELDALAQKIKEIHANATAVARQSSQARLEAEKTASDRIRQIQEEQLGKLTSINRQQTRMLEIAEEERTRIIQREAKMQEEARKTALQRLEDQAKQHFGEAHRAHREMTDSFLRGGEGFLTLGRGIAELGIANEENAEKMLKVLVQVQGAYDVAKGGIEVYRSLRTGLESYRASLLAAAAAREALNSAETRGTVSSAARFGTGALGQTAANVAGTSGLASTLSTAIGGLGTTLGAAIFSLPGAIALAITGIGGAGAMAFNVGGIRDRAAGMIPEEYVDPNSLFSQVLGSGSVGANRLSKRAGQEAQARTDRMLAQRESYESGPEFEMFQRHNHAAQTRFDEDRQSWMARNVMADRLVALRGGPDWQMASHRLWRSQMDMRTANELRDQAESLSPGRMREAEIERARQLQMDASERVLQMTKEKYQLERQSATERLQAARNETREIQHQIDLKVKERDHIRDQFLSAKERFGRLGETERRQTIGAMQDARAGRPLSQHQLGLLSNVGTQEASGIASKGFQDIADRSGFGGLAPNAHGVFGELERKRLAQLGTGRPGETGTILSKLQADLKMRHEVTVNVQMEVDQLAQMVVDTVQPLMEQQLAKFGHEVDKKLNSRDATRRPPTTPFNTSIGG